MNNFTRKTIPLFAIPCLLTVLVVGLGRPLYAGAAKQAANIAFANDQLAAQSPFLMPPFYGTVQVNCVFDHEYPQYAAEIQGVPITDTFQVTSTVLHNEAAAGQTAASERRDVTADTVGSTTIWRNSLCWPPQAA
jgi:hypothetical protein